MSVDCTVLEAPHEAHKPSQSIESVNKNKSERKSTHRQHNCNVVEDCYLTSISINDDSDIEAA